MATSVQSTIQKEIDSYLNHAQFPTRSFVVLDKKGDASIPANCHIRFKNCNFNSFKATQGNNNFYFENCIFSNENEVYNLEGCSAIFKDCNFSAKFSFTISKAEIQTSYIYKTIQVDNHSYLKSIKNIYNADIGVDDKIGLQVDRTSRVESYFDSFNNWTEKVVSCTDKSYVKLSAPIVEGFEKIFVECKRNSLVQIYDLKDVTVEKLQVNFFNLDINAAIELYGAGILKLKGKFITSAGNSSIKIRKMTGINHTGGTGPLINLDGSSVEVSEFGDEKGNGIKSVSAPILKAKLSSFKAYNLSFIEGNSSTPVFDLDTSELSIINSQKKDLWIFQNKLGGFCTALNSVIYIKNIKKIFSNSATLFDLKNTKINVINCTDMIAGAGYGITGTTCSVYLSKITNATSILEFINLSKGSSIYLSTIEHLIRGIYINDSRIVAKEIKNFDGRNLSALKINNSYVLILNCTEVKSDYSYTITILGNSNVNLKNISSIKSDAAAAITTSGDAAGGSINITDVGSIEGTTTGITIKDYDLTIKNSKKDSCLIKGSSTALSMSASTEGSYELNMEGPIELQAIKSLSAENIIINGKGITYSGDVNTKTCINNSTYSILGAGKNYTDNGSVINFVRSEIGGAFNSREKSFISSIKSKFSSTINLLDSILKSDLSELTGFTSQGSSYVGMLTKISGLISTDSSFVGQFGGSFGSAVIRGKSTLLAGALSSGTINTASAEPYTVTAAFSTEGGDTLLQTSNVLYNSALDYVGKFRGTYVLSVQSKITVTSASEGLYINTSAYITGISPIIRWN